MTSFYLPTKPYDIIDCINRIAAATGSVRHAQMTSHADYNGHALALYWNDYRGYYVGEYHWGERVVLVRNERFAPALATMKVEYARQGKGARLVVTPRPADEPLARADTDLTEGSEDLSKAAWYTWKHTEAVQALRLHTDHLLLKATDLDHYRRLQGIEEVIHTYPDGSTSKGTRINPLLAKAEQAKLGGV